ncbi:hypothetical protein, partial [Tropicimonas sp. IMCC6043]|uniref:hypothetical protein n=1 Tax=Tropicimonas sp. IMCC6043 TaxID=2510645 RepID=UPI001A90EE8C
LADQGAPATASYIGSASAGAPITLELAGFCAALWQEIAPPLTGDPGVRTWRLPHGSDLDFTQIPASMSSKIREIVIASGLRRVRWLVPSALPGP